MDLKIVITNVDENGVHMLEGEASDATVQKINASLLWLGELQSVDSVKAAPKKAEAEAKPKKADAKKADEAPAEKKEAPKSAAKAEPKPEAKAEPKSAAKPAAPKKTSAIAK